MSKFSSIFLVLLLFFTLKAFRVILSARFLTFASKLGIESDLGSAKGSPCDGDRLSEGFAGSLPAESPARSSLASLVLHLIVSFTGCGGA